jgi:hypothetical protein
MKRIKTVEILRNNFIDIATEFDKMLQGADIMTNEEHQKIINYEKLKLLTLISQNEKLDLDMMKIKYLNMSEPEKKIIKKEPIKDELLDAVVINTVTYYYQLKENGNIYNNKSEIIGRYNNGKFLFNK